MVNWPSSLVDAIARRKAVIIIGSGVSANASDANGAHPPTWAKFLLSACESIPPANARFGNLVKKALKSNNYLHACELLKRAHEGEWSNVVRSHFQTPNYRPAKIHEHIFNLDTRIVISLNFDSIYDRYALSKSEGTFYVKNYHDDDIAQLISGPDRYLIKAHGSIDTIGKLIFTQVDYARARIKHSDFYKILDSILLLNTVIMIGCGVSDPDMQLIFENNRFLFNTNSHYMVLPKGTADEDRQIYEYSRGIRIVEFRAKKNDYSDLTNSLAELVTQVENRRQAISTAMDW